MTTETTDNLEMDRIPSMKLITAIKGNHSGFFTDMGMVTAQIWATDNSK
jgi:hypothetical protein